MNYRSLEGDKLENVLRLIRTLNVGPVTFFQLIARFGTAAAALDALPELSLRGGRRNPLVAFDAEEAQKEITRVEKFGARMIMYGAPDYPELLLNIPDPPPVITVSGRPHLWQKKDLIAMVGARNASANGCQFASRIAQELGNAGIIVVSGLARGIDSFVHKGALKNGTVAVIAGGIDNIYPPEHDALYAQIRDMGAIISEQPFGAVPFAGSFPGRNRIIAAMSLGVVVVEASPKSGSLITARLALEYNREVFAVPGSPLDPRSKGCNQLLRQGALMVESAGDIIQALTQLRRAAMEEKPPASYHVLLPADEPSSSELESARRLLLEKLSASPVLVDELIEQCHLSPSAALTALLELELAGLIRRSAGNQVSLCVTLDEETV